MKRFALVAALLLACRAGAAEEFRYVWAGCSTAFRTGLDGREANIAASAAKLNGITIAPGEEFSFNERVGNTVPEEELAPASTLSGGKRVQGEGGGFCQTSSTLYCAALKAGLSIRERKPHTSPVRYLGPGLDATVSLDEGIDLKLLNPYAVPVLIRSKVERGTLSIAIAGTKPSPRKILLKVDGPRRSGDMVSTTTTRIVCDKKGKELFREIVSRDTYRAAKSKGQN